MSEAVEKTGKISASAASRWFLSLVLMVVTGVLTTGIWSLIDRIDKFSKQVDTVEDTIREKVKPAYGQLMALHEVQHAMAVRLEGMERAMRILGYPVPEYEPPEFWPDEETTEDQSDEEPAPDPDFGEGLKETIKDWLLDPTEQRALHESPKAAPKPRKERVEDYQQQLQEQFQLEK